MKWFTVIWAFYLMVLSIVPCSDTHNRCNTSGTLAVSEPSHRHSQDKDDVCPPFCHCSCCSLSVVITNPGFFSEGKPVVNHIADKVFIRDFSFLSNYYGSIWQPPKINS